MKRVVLVFPDAESILEFVLKHSPSNSEVNSVEQRLTSILTDAQIIDAELNYKAILKTLVLADTINY